MWCSLAGRVTGCWLAELQHYFWCSPQELLLRTFNLIFPPKADIRSSPLQPWYPGKLLMLCRIRYSRDCVQLVQMAFESCLREGLLEFWVVLNLNDSKDKYAGLLVQHNSLGNLIQTPQQLLPVLSWIFFTFCSWPHRGWGNLLTLWFPNFLFSAINWSKLHCIPTAMTVVEYLVNNLCLSPRAHDRELNKEAVLSAGDHTESTILLFDVMSGDNPSAFMWWDEGGSLTAKTTATLTAALTFPILWSLTSFKTRSWSRQTPSQLPVLVIWADEPKIDTA